MSKRIPPEAFEFYLGLGTGRSYQAVADKFGVSKTGITNRAKKEDWQARIDKIERDARARGEQRAVESLETMNARHLQTLRVIQGKALEVLRHTQLDSAIEAVRALDMSIRQERVVRGEPSERTAINVEDIVRKHYAQWMTDNGQDENQTEVSS